MYNRYIPGADGYTRVVEGETPPRRPPFREAAGQVSESGSKSGRQPGGISGLLRSLGLDELDRGDILLLLILFLILTDSDDLDPVITLGLLLLFSLGGKDKPRE